MIASSVFVLSALTLTGIYMKSVNRESQDDGYMIDFTALENDAEDKLQEIAQNDQDGAGMGINNPFGGDLNAILDDEMDFLPSEEYFPRRRQRRLRRLKSRRHPGSRSSRMQGRRYRRSRKEIRRKTSSLKRYSPRRVRWWHRPLTLRRARVCCAR